MAPRLVWQADEETGLQRRSCLGLDLQQRSDLRPGLLCRSGLKLDLQRRLDMKTYLPMTDWGPDLQRKSYSESDY